MALGEPLQVLVQELAAPLSVGRAAAVEDVRPVIHQVDEALGARPQAEVVLLGVAIGEGGDVEAARAVEGQPAHVHAEAVAGGGPRDRPRADARHEVRHVLHRHAVWQVVVHVGDRHGERAGRVAHGRYRRDVPLASRDLRQATQPALGDDRVAVEQHDVSVHGVAAELHGGRVPEAGRIADQRDVFVPGDELIEMAAQALVLAGVVHEQHAVGVTGALEDRVQAFTRRLGGVMDRHQDRDGCAPAGGDGRTGEPVG